MNRAPALRMARRSARLPSGLAALVAAAALIAAACGPNNPGTDASTDAARDGALDGAGSEGGQSCTNDDQCSDGVFCNGAERCAMGTCQAGTPPCDDRRSCTADSCDEENDQCAHEADNSMCSSGNACLGISRCDPQAANSSPTTGCTIVRPEDVPDCNDGNNCTLDSCDPTVGCVHAPRDLDGDGHVDRACTVDGTERGAQGDDCDDSNPDAYPGSVELCTDGRDNNCNGLIDYQESSMCRATNDTCDSAQSIEPGSYWGSTVGLANDYALGCNAGTFADAVYSFTLTATRDVTLSINSTATNAAISVVSGCGTPLSELRCARTTSGTAPSLRLRSLAPGTYRVLVESGSTPAAFRLTYRSDPATMVAPEESCPASASAPVVDLENGSMRTVRFSTLEHDYALSCGVANRRDAVFRMRLSETSNVTLRALSAAMTGTAYLSVRRDPCGDSGGELRCTTGAGATAAVYSQRGLAAGTYWVYVEHSTDADVTLLATIAPAPLTPTYTLTESPMGVNFVDVCAAMGSTRVLRPAMGETLLDDEVVNIPAAMLPFAVRMYGNTAAMGLTVSTNGWLSLMPSMSSSFSGRLGVMGEPDNVIAPLWTDLATRAGGVCYGVTGTAPNRVLIVQWDDATDKLSDESHLTFEVQILEAGGTGNNTINFVYQRLDGLSRLPSAGIENEDASLVTAIEGLVFTAPRAVRFTPSI